VRPPGLEPGTH